MSVITYDTTLQQWMSQANLPSFLRIYAQGLKYCEGDTARAALMDHGWTFEGDERRCP